MCCKGGYVTSGWIVEEAEVLFKVSKEGLWEVFWDITARHKINEKHLNKEVESGLDIWL